MIRRGSKRCLSAWKAPPFLKNIQFEVARKVRVIDLTHYIYAEMPVYPGTEHPTFSTPCTIAQNGFTERKITLFSHTGTHIDAPAHIIPGAKTLDQVDIDNYFGRACSLDVTSVKEGTIDIADLKPYEGLIKEVDFVLLHTGWSELWHKDTYFEGYPVLSPEAATWISQFRLKGLGVDMISIDREVTADFPIHRILLEQNILIIENLTNLQGLPGMGFSFSCLPLKFENSDGSPVRAIAVVP